jgi:hypothetical protein
MLIASPPRSRGRRGGGSPLIGVAPPPVVSGGEAVPGATLAGSAPRPRQSCMRAACLLLACHVPPFPDPLRQSHPRPCPPERVSAVGLPRPIDGYVSPFARRPHLSVRRQNVAGRITRSRDLARSESLTGSGSMQIAGASSISVLRTARVDAEGRTLPQDIHQPLYPWPWGSCCAIAPSHGPPDLPLPLRSQY